MGSAHFEACLVLNGLSAMLNMNRFRCEYRDDKPCVQQISSNTLLTAGSSLWSSSAGRTRENHKRAMFNNSRSSTESEHKTHCARFIPIIESLLPRALITDGIIKAVAVHHQVVVSNGCAFKGAFECHEQAKQDLMMALHWLRMKRPSRRVCEREKVHYNTWETCGALTRADTAVFMCLVEIIDAFWLQGPLHCSQQYFQDLVIHDLLHQVFF